MKKKYITRFKETVASDLCKAAIPMLYAEACEKDERRKHLKLKRFVKSAKHQTDVHLNRFFYHKLF